MRHLWSHRRFACATEQSQAPKCCVVETFEINSAHVAHQDPVVITVIVTSSVIIYNDFQNPLYFLPGKDNATVQLTLYNFRGQFNTQWNLLFMDVLLITIPPLIMFMFFSRKIVAGLTAGAIKG